jgi:hypothetical protein
VTLTNGLNARGTLIEYQSKFDLDQYANRFYRVVETDPGLAPYFTVDPINDSATADVAYVGSVANATDPNGDTLTYSKVSGPAWLAVAADGSLSGTPAQSDAGVNIFTVQVDDGTDGTDTATLNITVVGDVVEGVVYHDTFDNDGLASNAGVGGGLDAKSYLGGNWAEAGNLSYDSAGLGDRAYASSLNSFDLSQGFTMTVKWIGTDSINGDSFGLSTTKITSTSADNDWLSWGGVGGNRDLSSISGAHAFYGIGLAFARNGDITDPYDKGLKFNNASGLPGEDGSGQLIQLSNPDIPTSGNNTFVLTVGTDNSYSYSLNGAAPVTGTIVDGGTFDLSQPFYFNAYSQAGTTTITEVKVVATSDQEPTNNAPGFTSDPINEISATEGAAYSSSIADDASDPESDPMTFSKVSGPAWLAAASDGTLSGTPSNSDVGANVFTVQVDALGGSDTATLSITVVDPTVNQPPVFTSDPINEIIAIEDAAYSSSIADDASDPESDPMTFSKVSGPAWLAVASDGTLSGTPSTSDVGANVFTVQVDATGGSDTATLNITVGTVNGALLISESFTTDLSGGTGLGAWTANNVDRNAHVWYTGDGTIAGTPDGSAIGQTQSGGFLRRASALGSSGIHSAIDGSVDLVTPGIVYFSALIEPNNGTADNHNASLILGSDPLNVPGGAPAGLMTAGEGLGFGLNGYTLHAYMYDGGVGTESTGSVAASNGSTLLIVGEIIWGATDTLNLYNITDVNAPLPTPFATVSGNLDESSFDTLAIADKRQTGIDEIRFGAQVADVISGN